MAIAVPVIDGRKVLKGIGFMVLAATLFPFLNATSKYLSADYAILQIVWARYLGHLVFVLAVFWPRHGPMLLRPKQPLVQLLRSMLLLSSSGIYFFALSYVPLATATQRSTPTFSPSIGLDSAVTSSGPVNEIAAAVASGT
jgi:drug/metabolite transporter (DMT)-like permease